MAKSRVWVGLDVGADELAICGSDEHGAVLFEHRAPNCETAVGNLLAPYRQRIELIAYESSPYAMILDRSLRERGYRIAAFDTRQASKFLAIRRNKTDKNDARGLSELARVGRASVSEVRVKGPECQQLRSMLVTRRKLVDVRVATEATMRSLFRLNGGRLKSCSSAAALKRNVADELERVRHLRKIDLTYDVEPLLALSEALRTYLEAMDKKFLRLAQEHPVCKRFLAITGVGPLCALSFYSAVEDPTRFRRSADIGPYFGMVPLIRQSGQTIRRHRITKLGDRMTRTLLVTAALHHLRYGNSALAAWGATLRERSGKGKAQVAVGRKLAVVMIAMWKSNQPYDPRRSPVCDGTLMLGAKDPTAA